MEFPWLTFYFHLANLLLIKRLLLCLQSLSFCTPIPYLLQRNLLGISVQKLCFWKMIGKDLIFNGLSCCLESLFKEILSALFSGIQRARIQPKRLPHRSYITYPSYGGKTCLPTSFLLQSDSVLHAFLYKKRCARVLRFSIFLVSLHHTRQCSGSVAGSQKRAGGKSGQQRAFRFWK